MAVAGVGCLRGQSPLRGSSVSICKVSGHGKACPLVTRAWLCGCGSVMQNSPSGCHGGCLSVLLATASSWPVSVWRALLVDAAVGGIAWAVAWDQSRSLPLAPRRWGAMGSPGPANRVCGSILVRGSPLAVPCPSAALLPLLGAANWAFCVPWQ